MTSFDPRIADALDRAVPLRTELAPAWSDVEARAAAPLRPRRRNVGRRWALAGALAGALAAAAGLSVGGLAIAGAIERSAPLHGATIGVSGTVLANGMSTCDLIGQSAARVAAKLTSGGIGVEWRFTHWGTTVVTTAGSPGLIGVTGGSSDAVSSVPGDSVVWDIVPDGRRQALVSVEAPNDPNAPTVATENCSG